jgi:hypothetical protein
MTPKSFVRGMLAVLFLTALVEPSFGQSPTNIACQLIDRADLHSLLGVKVDVKDAMSANDLEMCSGETDKLKVSVVVTSMRDTARKVEQMEEALKQKYDNVGSKVDVKTADGIMCVIVEPSSAEAAVKQGYPSGCMIVTKLPKYAVIDATAKTKEARIPIDKLRAAAQKMAERF